MEFGEDPTAKRCSAWNVPSPLPSKTDTSLRGLDLPSLFPKKDRPVVEVVVAGHPTLPPTPVPARHGQGWNVSPHKALRGLERPIPVAEHDPHVVAVGRAAVGRDHIEP